MMDVPRLFIASVPTCLIVALLAEVREGLEDSCPGRSSIISLKEVA